MDNVKMLSDYLRFVHRMIECIALEIDVSLHMAWLDPLVVASIKPTNKEIDRRADRH